MTGVQTCALPILEITLLNDSNKEVVEYLEKSYLPESIFVTINDSQKLENLQYPFFEGKNFDSNTSTVYVCKDFTCSLPLQKIEDIKNNIS